MIEFISVFVSVLSCDYNVLIWIICVLRKKHFDVLILFCCHKIRNYIHLRGKYWVNLDYIFGTHNMHKTLRTMHIYESG